MAAAKADTDIADAITKKHTEGDDQALGTLGTKASPVDADKVIHRNSASSDALVTSTWTQIKAFFKTYFDSLYSAITHSHAHSAMSNLDVDDHPQYILHSLATAVSDFLVASGAGVFIKKTLAEVKTILGLGSAAYTAATAYVTHALATAANDFLVASGSGAYVKKTLAEVKTILGITNVEDTTHSTDAHTMTIDGRDVSADGTKLDGIDSGAKDDQTGAEIKTAYEAEADTNAYDDAAVSKLGGIEASAVALATVKADADIADAISTKHAEGEDQALGALGTKDPPIDADKVVYRNSASSDALVTSTWTQVKAFLKTYFDPLTQTLTNKTLIATSNVIEEISTVASDATPNPTGGSLRNFYTITALAEATATFAAPSGTPVNGNKLTIRIKDDGTGRTLAWNAIYRALEFALPTATTASKTIYLGFIYNSAETKWDLVAVNEEA